MAASAHSAFAPQPSNGCDVCNVSALSQMAAVLVILLALSCRATGEVARPRGVAVSRAALYDPLARPAFTCLDGSASVPFPRVNDDYCDCADGSDEPGTAACPNGSFHCTNAGHRPLTIRSSRVNDGVCDCCDASDEYDRPDADCRNNCLDLGLSAMAEQQRELEERKRGAQARLELSRQGAQMRQEKRARLEQLRQSLREAEELAEQRQQALRLAEEAETAALAKYRQLEQAEEEAQAEAAFRRLDTDADGRLAVGELQTNAIFDRDRDGSVSDEEARWFLDDNEAVALDEFKQRAWPRIRDVELAPSRATAQSVEEEEQQQRAKGDDQHAEEANDDEHEHELESEDEEATEGDTEGDADADADANAETSAPAPPPVQYDDETQRLVDLAEEARSEHSKASHAVSDLERQTRELEDFLQTDYGADSEFAPLHGECFEYEADREYVYRFCPFSLVNQQQKFGGLDTRLGAWGRWAGPEHDKYSRMLYEQGAACWNGPQRSTTVRLVCGAENRVLGVAEPNRCEYVLDFSTPAACAAQVASEDEAKHDEL